VSVTMLTFRMQLYWWCQLPLLLILCPEHSRTVHDTLFLLDIEVYVLTFLLCVTHPAPPFECRFARPLARKENRFAP